MPAPEPIPDLLKAVNEASGKAFALWLTFLTVGIYLAIAIGTTTHLQLLLAGPVRLPLLGVDMPLFAFYGFAPLMFLVLHLYVLVQLYLFANLLRLFDDTLRAADMIEQDCRQIRAQLDKFVFTQFLIGAPQETTIRRFLWAVVWFSFVVGPVLLLLGFEFRFFPYRGSFVTSMQTAAVTSDLVLIMLLWGKIDTDVQKLLEVKFWRRLFYFLLALTWAVAELTPRGFAHLVLENEHLVEPDEAKLKNLAVTLSLRNRDFTFGSFRGSDLRKADFTGANLGAADLTDAKLTYAVLKGATLMEAILIGTKLSDADLSGADLWHADLTGANLSGANLSGAKGLLQTQLDKACGTGVKGLDKLTPPLTIKPCG